MSKTAHKIVRLELPKEISFSYDHTATLTRGTPAMLICALKKDSLYDFEQLLFKARHKSAFKEHRYINIRSKTYAIEAPLLLIVILISYPEIEFLSIKPIA